MTNGWRWAGPAALLVLLAWAPFAGAQEPSGIFGEQIEVRVVNLEVVVTDRDGNRVTGLGPEDFRLRVDGDEVPVGFFSEISEGLRAPSEGGGAPDLADGSNPTGAAPGEAVGISYLVFLDNFFAPIPRDRDKVLRGMLEQIGELGPRDRMAFVIFHRRRIELIHSWTSSPREIEGAILRMMGRAPGQGGGGGAVLGVGRTLLSGSGESPGAAMQELNKSLERVVRGVNATLRGFAAAPGRKVMLLLSGGWPQDPCVYLQGQVTPLERGIECDNQTPLIWRSLYETANLLGYTLYPVDVGPGSQAGSDTLREAEIHSTLRTLASGTGGLPLINATRHLALERVIEDTRSYYWLGFNPEWQGDDKRRKIRLEVLRPGLKLRYRESFRDLSRSQEMDFLVESVLLFGGELPAAGKLNLALGSAKRRGLGGTRMELPLRLVIPMDEVVMLPHRGRYVAELELRVGALGKSGDVNEITAVPVVLDGDDPPPKGSHAIYEVAIKIRRQPQDLVVSLYDPIGDRILVANARFEP